MRFSVLVRLKGKPGKFPVKWKSTFKRYVVCADKFHVSDNPATSFLEQELEAVVAMTVARADFKSLEVILDE